MQVCSPTRPPCWQGMVFFAFVLDVCTRRIVGAVRRVRQQPHHTASGVPWPAAGGPVVLRTPRWQQALEDGLAPTVVLEASHQRAFETLSLEDLRAHVAA